VFVFESRSGKPAQVLAPEEPVPGQRFGFALAAAGNSLVASAPGGTGATSGAIEVFVRSDEDGRFRRSESLPPPAGFDGSNFGGRVALSVDARWLAATAGGGVVLVFRNDGGRWAFHSEIRAHGDAAGAADGGLAFSGRRRLLIGSPGGIWDGKRTGLVSLVEWDEADDEWQARRTIAPETGAQDGNFGISVASAGDRVWIGAGADHTDREFGGAAYPVVLPRFEGQRFPTVSPIPSAGSDVAIHGRVAAVGSPGIDNRAFGGRLQIFERPENGGWKVAYQTPEQDLTQVPSGSFARVSLSGRRVVATPGGTVYEKQNGTWGPAEPVQLPGQVLEVASSGDDGLFVFSGGRAAIVDMASRSDGDYYQVEPAGKIKILRAAVFGGVALFRSLYDKHLTALRKAGASWETSTVQPPDELPFGGSFAHGIDLDGRRAIVGTPCYNGNNESGFGGAAHVYDLEAPGAAPTPLPCPEGGSDEMTAHGFAVAIRGDTALVSNPYVRRGLAPGRVYLYRRDPGSDTWHHAETLQASNAEPGDEFGVSLGLDDGWAVVGAKSEWVYFFNVD
jgi:hypothetical protein